MAVVFVFRGSRVVSILSSLVYRVQNVENDLFIKQIATYFAKAAKSRLRIHKTIENLLENSNRMLNVSALTKQCMQNKLHWLAKTS